SGFPTVRLTGFFQADAGWFYQDAASRLAVGDVQDGADFRRARLAATGNVWDNVGYILEYDFAFPGRPNFMDVWLEVRDLEVLGNLRVGQFKHPIGMEGLTSVRELTFMERALPFAFLPFRQIGLMAHDVAEDESSTWSVSAFRFPTDAFGGNVGDNGGYAMATRFTWLPVDEVDSGSFVHFGAAYSFGDPATDRVRYRNQPEFFVSETGGADLVPVGVPANVPPFVDTGPIAANNFNLFGVEAATSVGSLHLQSESIYAVVNQIGGPTVAFSGAYVQAGYILTGETRPYDHDKGVLGRIVPDEPFSRYRGRGAWEVAVRWSYLDLSDKNIRGGRLNDLTAGINWYLNRFTKCQLNYIHAFLDTPGLGDSDADIVAARGQIDF
ncbi:MAG: OprO/OprP family phosphate-selective porin, partial [Pirellulales bacterium]